MFFIGGDIGQQRDYSALAILEHVQRVRERNALPGTIEWQQEKPVIVNEYELRLLEQFPLQTPYPQIVERIVQITRNPKIALLYKLIIDATGVGRPIVDMIRTHGIVPVAVTITGGYKVNVDKTGFGYTVPKRDLVSALQMLFHSERIRVAPKLKLAAQFREQLKYFTVKINTKGNETYEAANENVHDDLVLAVALAAWYAEKRNGAEVTSPVIRGRKKEYDPLRHDLGGE